MRTLTLAAVCAAALASGLLAAPIPKMKEKTTEQKLLGKWKLVKSDAGQPTAYEFVIEFKPKGELAFVRTPTRGGGRASVAPGKYTVVADDKVDWKVNENGSERGETSKIKLLNQEKLIIEDPQGIKEEFERVVEKPKGEKKDDPKKEEPKKTDPKKDGE